MPLPVRLLRETWEYASLSAKHVTLFALRRNRAHAMTLGVDLGAIFKAHYTAQMEEEKEMKPEKSGYYLCFSTVKNSTRWRVHWFNANAQRFDTSGTVYVWRRLPPPPAGFDAEGG